MRMTLGIWAFGPTIRGAVAVAPSWRLIDSDAADLDMPVPREPPASRACGVPGA